MGTLFFYLYSLLHYFDWAFVNKQAQNEIKGQSKCAQNC